MDVVYVYFIIMTELNVNGNKHCRNHWTKRKLVVIIIAYGLVF